MDKNLKELLDVYKKKQFGKSIGFGKIPALLVVDFINAFTDEASPLGADFSFQLKHTKTLLKEARKKGIPIIFTTVAYEPNMSDAGIWRVKTPTDKLILGTKPVELDKTLERRMDEPLIVKKYASAFFGTHLISLLNVARVDTIIVTGCTTSGCIRATVVDGVSYGFRMMVVEEAVGDRAELTHLVSLADINAKYGDVISVAVALDFLKSLHK
ncbi:MAG TPA: carbamoylsarcosine amidase [Rikenellaceae bacterium]|nr:carbamoylsarcosine amidase [Rikenellaceae bacterium]